MPATKFRTQVKANSGLVVDELFTAATDLSSRQYYFVVPSSSPGEVTAATGASNPTPLGVLQNAPTASQLARVRVFGRTQIAASPNACDIGWANFITANACGAGIASIQSGCTVLGRWLSASLPSGTPASGIGFVNCIAFSGCTLGATGS